VQILLLRSSQIRNLDSTRFAEPYVWNMSRFVFAIQMLTERLQSGKTEFKILKVCSIITKRCTDGLWLTTSNVANGRGRRYKQASDTQAEEDATWKLWLG
jgi:hypothetical protein